MYKVLEHFSDLQDNRFQYNTGDVFPREGYTPSAERIEELSTDNNRRHRPMIELVQVKPKKELEEDFMNPPVEEPKAEEPKEEEPVKPKRGRKKKNAE